MSSLHLRNAAGLLVAVLTATLALSAQACGGSISLHEQMPTVESMKNSLKQKGICKRLAPMGFKCMCGELKLFYKIPVSFFRVGSAELPQALQNDLDLLALLLRLSNPESVPARIWIDAEVPEMAEAPGRLETKRAGSVRDYLVSKGVDHGLLYLQDQSAP
jgi:outer membrane protein OmpA-like peptidoglycan-associated protein